MADEARPPPAQYSHSREGGFKSEEDDEDRRYPPKPVHAGSGNGSSNGNSNGNSNGTNNGNGKRSSVGSGGSNGNPVTLPSFREAYGSALTQYPAQPPPPPPPPPAPAPHHDHTGRPIPGPPRPQFLQDLRDLQDRWDLQDHQDHRDHQFTTALIVLAVLTVLMALLVRPAARTIHITPRVCTHIPIRATVTAMATVLRTAPTLITLPVTPRTGPSSSYL
ncbi:hypothetical protein SEPCBS119000_005144 [Sporothrix epigloea]|uniref:Uncharacterized protein n=1 Tax=Sporothrix epigloea TaxID=1892477 RepID=A0ABP0DX53_9PEZI